MDYAIRITGLSSPPAVAYTTEQYRPGVTVVNEGVTPNAATGTLRIYDRASGLLIESCDIYSGTIPAGDSKIAQADSYWLPPYVGDFLAIAHLDATNAQADMPPAFFSVSSLPPPPPPTVPAHAEQHQDGGADELDVTDLAGVLLENQHPEDHAANHQVAGSDVLNVAGLSGLLADAQTPAAHSATKHDQTVEATANKGAASGYCGLDSNQLVAFDNIPTHVEKVIYCRNPESSATINSKTNILDFTSTPYTSELYCMVLVELDTQPAVATKIGITIDGDTHEFSMPVLGATLRFPVYFAHFKETNKTNAQVVVYIDPNGGSCYYKFSFVRIADYRFLL